MSHKKRAAPQGTEQLMTLNAALLPAFIQVKYLDAIDGVTTQVSKRDSYCSVNACFILKPRL